MKVRVTVTVERALVAEVDNLPENVSRSSVFEQALREYLASRGRVQPR